MNRAAFLAAIVFLGATLSCARHTDFPAALELLTSPAPENFTVTSSDDVNYDLSWTISDPTNVAYYLLYTLNTSGAFTEIDSTTATAVQVNTFFPTPGIVFGVASVSTGNVSSPIVSGSRDN